VRVTSYRKIKKVLFHPEIKEHLIPGFESVPIGERYYYLEAGEGLVIFVSCEKHTELHAALFKHDKNKKQLIIDCIEWMKENVGMTYMIARINPANKPARRMAIELGLELINTGEQVIYGKHC
jgi:hypothetical protein